jgi:hypothetical protein
MKELVFLSSFKIILAGCSTITFVWLPGIIGPVPSATLDKSVLLRCE